MRIKFPFSGEKCPNASEAWWSNQNELKGQGLEPFKLRCPAGPEKLMELTKFV
jgi:hypothetical protein